jgi:hypothetical protein
MTEESTLQLGYTSPMWRPADPFKKEPRKQRNPIGFVHFGEPEEEPRSYLDEYIQFIQDAGQEEFHDELFVGFTAPINSGDVI